MNETLQLLSWLIVIEALGAACLPLIRKLLPDFSDQGWIFGKITGLLLLAYIAWIGGMLKLLSFSRLNLLIIFAVLLTVNFLVNRNSLRNWIGPSGRKLIFFEEAIFLVGFLFWTFVRSHNPDIHDLEKFMDFGFINSILRSSYFPPKDIWLSGGSINYYYFGHLVTAVLIRLSGVLPPVGYNLMLALLFGLTFSASFSLGFNIFGRLTQGASRSRELLAGFLTAVFLTLLGNLQVIFAFIKGFSTYWYPEATRFIPRTIHEFPIYSFVVADLHGHILDIPFVLLGLALLFANFIQPKDGENSKSFAVIFGFLLATMYMTNAADALIYFGIYVFLTLFLPFLTGAVSLNTTALKTHFFHLFRKAFLVLLSLLVFSLPFDLTFKQFTDGVSLVPPSERSPLWMILVLWGAPLFFGLTFSLYFFLRSRRTAVESFLLLLFFFSLILVAVPELIYFKDIYAGYPRANTMFKFTYQAFIIFSIVSGYAFTKFLTLWPLKLKPQRSLWSLAALLIVWVMGFYPYFAVTSAYGKDLLKNGRGLNGLTYLAKLHPGDFEAVKWINENIKGQPVILEAVGESYTDYARISANTGLPTVLGWPVHEWLWRKDVKITEVRRADVAAIYTSPSITETKKLLRQYNVRYVYIGELEREKYLLLAEPKFFILGKIVHQNPTAVLFKLGI